MSLKFHYQEPGVEDILTNRDWNSFSLDYFSRLLSLRWLRKDIPGESPNLTPMVCPGGLKNLFNLTNESCC